MMCEWTNYIFLPLVPASFHPSLLLSLITSLLPFSLSLTSIYPSVLSPSSFLIHFLPSSLNLFLHLLSSFLTFLLLSFRSFSFLFFFPCFFLDSLFSSTPFLTFIFRPFLFSSLPSLLPHLFLSCITHFFSSKTLPPCFLPFFSTSLFPSFLTSFCP